MSACGPFTAFCLLAIKQEQYSAYDIVIIVSTRNPKYILVSLSVSNRMLMWMTVGVYITGKQWQANDVIVWLPHAKTEV